MALGLETEVFALTSESKVVELTASNRKRMICCTAEMNFREVFYMKFSYIKKKSPNGIRYIHVRCIKNTI